MDRFLARATRLLAVQLLVLTAVIHLSWGLPRVFAYLDPAAIELYLSTDAVPDLRGAYVFADYVARGRLLAVDTGAEPPWEIATVPTVGDTDPGQFVLGFGRDADGDLYVLSTDESGGEGDSGRIDRLVAP